MMNSYVDMKLMKTTQRFSLQTEGFICLLMSLVMLTSACSMTGFGGRRFDSPQSTTVGATWAFLYIMEMEFEKPLTNAEGSGIDYALNLSVFDFFVTADTSSNLNDDEEEIDGSHGIIFRDPYLLYGIGGWGKQNGNSAWNAGGGVMIRVPKLFSARRLLSVTPDPPDLIGPFLRSDYRHFFEHDKKDSNRIYLGLEWFVSTSVLPSASRGNGTISGQH